MEPVRRGRCQGIARRVGFEIGECRTTNRNRQSVIRRKFGNPHLTGSGGLKKLAGRGDGFNRGQNEGGGEEFPEDFRTAVF